MGSSELKGGKNGKTGREARLSAALRENLKRRKAQSRQRQSETTASGAEKSGD